MTDRCEPPIEMRNKIAQHYIVIGDVMTSFVVWTWCGSVWRLTDGSTFPPAKAFLCGARYAGPVPSPAQLADLVTALDRIAHEPTTGGSLIAIDALHKYEPSRRVLNESPLPEIDKTIKPPAKYYPERQS
jgi:hypothetical protein